MYGLSSSSSSNSSNQTKLSSSSFSSQRSTLFSKPSSLPLHKSSSSSTTSSSTKNDGKSGELREPEEWLAEIEKRSSADKKDLIPVYLEAMNSIDFTRHLNSPELVGGVWLEFIALQHSTGNADNQTVRRFFQKMLSIRLGVGLALFWHKWAVFEAEKCGDSGAALELVRKGLALHATPVSLLQSYESRLLDQSLLKSAHNLSISTSSSTSASTIVKQAIERRFPKRFGSLGPVRRVTDGFSDDDEEDENTDEQLLASRYKNNSGKLHGTNTIKASDRQSNSNISATITPQSIKSSLSSSSPDSVDQKENTPISNGSGKSVDQKEKEQRQQQQQTNVTMTMDIVVSPPKRTQDDTATLNMNNNNKAAGAVTPTSDAVPAINQSMESCSSSESVTQKPHSKSQKASPLKTAILVNGKPYAKLELLGKGGSSKVFKVLCPQSGRLFALKKVSLRGVDDVTMSGYENEIGLLKKLAACERIIRLYEWEVNRKEGYLHMVMELGEIDLAHVLQKQSSEKVNLNFVRVYWEQMLQAVQTIHEERVVHTDLKPANFLFVRGALKLIDFGIAKTIQNDTTNIHREHQVGTVNYMSPEAIMDTNSNKDGTRVQCMKLGRPSDTWSLGCILYQMTYGHTPFSHLQMIPKLQKIIDPNYPIDYPTLPPHMDNPYLVDAIRGCLHREPKERLTIPELLEHPFLKPDRIMRQLQDFSLGRIEWIVRQTLQLSQTDSKSHHQEQQQIAKQIYQQLITQKPSNM